MKALKIIGLIVLALVVIVLGLSFIAPTKMHSERDVKTFANSQKWSPWREKDTTAKVTIEGTDGAVGAKLLWDGNKDMGQGEQTITKMEENKSVESDLHFIKPFDAHASSYVRLEDTAGGCNVIWGFNSEMPRPWNVMHLFMGDKMMNDDFDKGLNKLKTLSEKDGIGKIYEIHEITTEPKAYIGVKKTLSLDKISPFFAENIPMLVTDLKKSNVQISEPMSGLYFTFDEKNMRTEVAAAIPVSATAGKVGKWETFHTKGGKTLEVDFYGDYKNLGIAHNQIKAYIAVKKLKFIAPVLEEYITDPMSEKDPAKWLTKIYYFVE